MVRLLLEHPRQLNWLRLHPEQIPDAIDEVLRYDAPIHMISRVAPEDTELAGVTVRKNEMVQLMVGAAHHDPDHFASPGDFDISRRASHLSFGGEFTTASATRWHVWRRTACSPPCSTGCPGCGSAHRPSGSRGWPSAA